jgi:hypothetical protein
MDTFKVFLAIVSADAAAGIVIPAADNSLDADPDHWPDPVFNAKTNGSETKEIYPFR